MKMKFDEVDPALIVAGKIGRDTSSKVEDDVLMKSIRTGGVQQPLVVIEDGNKYRLIDGSRRLHAAVVLGLPRVPVVIDSVPAGTTPDEYVRKIRFILDEHRQDLLPSQKSELIVKLKETMGLGNQKVAAYLGVDPDSITNWLAVQKYIPPVVDALDRGILTQQAARVFDGLSEKGQKEIFSKHLDDIRKLKGEAHKTIRSLYPPEKFSAFYANPGLTAQRLKRKSGPRKSAPRVGYSVAEKKRLMNSVSMKEDELEVLKEEEKKLKKECIAAGPIVAAMLRSPQIAKQLPENVIEELKAFADSY